MSLTPGTRIGPYDITALLGAGGMGEVYRATDSLLKRQVAIKVLPAALAGDGDRLARFQREAEVLAGLNHPNIAAIYGLEKTADFTALVIELVEGEDLTQRIAQGALPIDEALPMASQIAEALEAAHDRGIVHRDLKPANIKVTPDGTVKVLDFGLAKAVHDEPSPGQSATAHLPTITSPAHVTRAGIVLGTAAYMAPEQARGRTVDKRADIWAFGVVLFEMLTGRRLFDGESVSDTLAAVLTGPLDPARDLPSAVPVVLRRLVARCLTRDVKLRLRDIGEARIALNAPEAYAVTEAGSVASPSRRTFVPLAITALVAAAVGAAAVLSFGRPSPPMAQTVVQASILLPPDAPVSRGGWRNLALSRDGSLLAYVVPGDRLWLRHMATGETRAVDGSVGGGNPFFSFDGAWLGFAIENRLLKMPVGGGSPLPITVAPGPAYGARWSADQTVSFSSLGTGVMEVPGGGGDPRLLIAPNRERRELAISWAQPLQGSDDLLFTVFPDSIASADDAQIVLESPGRANARQVLTGGTSAFYLPTGHLAFGHSNRIVAAPFDVIGRRLAGPAVPVVEDVQISRINGGLNAAVSDTGTLVYVPAGRAPQTQFVEISRSGTVRQLGEPLAMTLDALALSPDGSRVAFRAAKANDDIHVFDIGRGTATRLTFDGGDEFNPVWSHDGAHIMYASNQTGAFAVYRRPADGSGAPQRLIDSANETRPSALSPDGSTLVYTEMAGASRDLMAFDLNGGKPPAPILRTPYDERHASISPDGLWVAFESNESGQWQVNIMRLRDGSGRRQLSIDGGTEPLWSADGRQLYFIAGDSIMAVEPIGAANALPRRLVQHQFGRLGNTYGKRFVVTRDGRFIAVTVNGSEPSREIRVVFNWFEVLKARVPIPR